MNLAGGNARGFNLAGCEVIQREREREREREGGGCSRRTWLGEMQEGST